MSRGDPLRDPLRDPLLAPLAADSGRAFEAPWQARLHALVDQLIARGVFTRAEQAEALGAAIRRAQAAGDPDRGDTYWQHYLAAVEALLKAKKLL